MHIFIVIVRIVDRCPTNRYFHAKYVGGNKRAFLTNYVPGYSLRAPVLTTHYTQQTLKVRFKPANNSDGNYSLQCVLNSVICICHIVLG